MCFIYPSYYTWTHNSSICRYDVQRQIRI